MDSNGWPQTQRNVALAHIRRAWAPHLSGDQHLGMTFQHGIENWNDGPYCHSSPAIVNTYYSRYWLPDGEGKNRNPNNSLPLTGEYLDGFANKITMLAYANPKKDKHKGSGYSLVYFDKGKRTIVFESWPAQADIANGDKPYEGWPITVSQQKNDGRKQVGTLGVITVKPPVYAEGKYTIKIGKGLADLKTLTGRTISKEKLMITVH